MVKILGIPDQLYMAMKYASDEQIGKAIRAAMQYFVSAGEDCSAEDDIAHDPITCTLYAVLKDSADRNIQYYRIHRYY